MAIINGDDYGNTLPGTSSDDVIDGRKGNDIINGGGGNDRIIGGLGNDTLTGGSGNDTFVYSLRGIGRDTITDFVRGTDKIDLSALNIGDFTTLLRFLSFDDQGDAVLTFGFDGEPESITLRTIKRNQLTKDDFKFSTSSAALTVNGTGYRDVLFGGNGNDTLTGNGGSDILTSGFGNDRINGGTGDDTLIGGAGNDTYLYTAREFGRDRIETFSTVRGSDQIDLSALNIGDFTTLERFITEDAQNNAVITLGFDGEPESITIVNVRKSDLRDFNFIFNTNSTALTVDGTGYRDVLFGGNGADSLTGFGGDDTLSGGKGNDRLLGMNGNDTLIGGEGNDVYLYYARSFGRDTIEGFNATPWTDRIDLSALNVADFATLSRFITEDSFGNAVITLGFYGDPESITLKNIKKAQLSGANFIFNTDATALAVEGTGYRDVLFGGNGADTLTGYGGDDTLTSGAGNDRLVGLSGADTLIGGIGADRMEGGEGNDIYFVDNAADQVVEAAAQGTDIVYATANYALVAGQHVETLSVAYTTSTNAINLSGNELAQRIIGNAGQNYLSGGGGNDVLIGGAGADTLVGGAGDDIFYVDNARDVIGEVAGGGTDTVLAGVSYALTAGRHIEVLATTSVAGTGAISLTGNELAQRINGNNGINVLNGGGGNDTLFGYNGNDTLIGGTGVDTLAGGYGNDRFYVDHAGDRVVEGYGEGTDVVFASVNYALAGGQYIETIATTSVAGTAAINLAGNEFAQQILGNNGNNRLYGNGGNDALNGYAGNDFLYGGIGNDTLTGGAGYDYFVFNTALNSWSNVDRITDFNVAADTIQLDNAVMAALGATTGTLNAGRFWKSTAGVAHDADDRIIYDTDSGMLFYDADGSGSRYSGIHFATLAPNLALTNADFQVI